MKSLFNGVCVAMITPFCNGKIDFDAMKKLLNRFVEAKVSAVAILATTGEGTCLSHKERSLIIKFCKRCLPQEIKLIVGVGSNNEKTLIKNIKQAKIYNVDGVLAVTPYYNKTTQDGIVEYYRRIHNEGLPVIAYNVPSRTGLNIELSTLKRLIREGLICGIKECSTDIFRITAVKNICKNKIALYSGEDSLNHIYFILGANGCISVCANVFPIYIKDIYNDVVNQKIKQALEKQNRISQYINALFCQTNPIPIKYSLSLLGICKDDVRKPLVCLNDKYKKIVKYQTEKMQNINNSN